MLMMPAFGFMRALDLPDIIKKPPREAAALNSFHLPKNKKTARRSRLRLQFPLVLLFRYLHVAFDNQHLMKHYKFYAY